MKVPQLIYKDKDDFMYFSSNYYLYDDLSKLLHFLLTLYKLCEFLSERVNQD